MITTTATTAMLMPAMAPPERLLLAAVAVSPRAVHAPAPAPLPEAHATQLDPAVAAQQMDPAQTPLAHSTFPPQLEPAASTQTPLAHVVPVTQLLVAAHAFPATSFDLHTPPDVT